MNSRAYARCESGKQYIGTATQFKDRVALHKDQAKDNANYFYKFVIKIGN